MAHTRFIELANSTHVVGEDDTTCGDDLVQEFVKAPQDLDSMNTSCAPLVRPSTRWASTPSRCPKSHH